MTGSPAINAIIFASLGVLLFVAALAIFVKLSPFNVWKEVSERNTAAAVVAGAVALGLAGIIAAAMH